MAFAGADDGPPLAAVGGAPLGDLLLDDVVQLEGDGGAAARVAGVGQQPVHDVRQPLHLRQRDRRLLLHRLRLVGEGDLLQPHGQRGQRRTELVGGVGGKAPLGGQHPGDPLGGGVQDVGDAVQLGDAVPLVPRARVPGAEAFGGLGEVGERGGETVGLPDRQQYGGDHGEQRHQTDDQQGPADLPGHRGPGLLDEDGLALLAGGPAPQDVAGRLLADLDDRLAGDADDGVPGVADLLPQEVLVDGAGADAVSYTHL